MEGLKNNYEKRCPNCEETFQAKRVNQTYCSKACRIQMHNHKDFKEKRNRTLITSDINDILWENREFLREVYDQIIEFDIDNELDLDDIKDEFDINYVTHIQKDPKFGTLYFCYDYAFALKKEGDWTFLEIVYR